VFKRGNHDLYSVNVKNENQNFVLFTNTKDEYINKQPTKINNHDIFNIIDYIYDLAYKLCIDIPTNIRHTFEIDFNNNDLLEAIKRVHAFNLNALQTQFCTPAQMTLLRMVQENKQNGKPLYFKFIIKSFTPDECKKYFFENCENYNTDKCCKVIAQQNTVDNQKS
jgi:hypothetical protein